jgi:twitching motility protein PilT
MTSDLHRQTIDPRLLKLFVAMGSHKASDLHLKTGQPPYFRVDSALRSVASDSLPAETLEVMVESLLDERHQSIFVAEGTVDLAYEIPGGDRFRINVFRQRGEISLAARRVTRDIPNFQALNLPALIAPIIQETAGLILLAGPTGSGKSTTIASMINEINRTRRSHIVTIEDPIEYLYTDQKSLVNQREIGIDVPDFATALRSMLREDPDVVLIGEMRDHETFAAALQASETGHLVFGTIHASSAAQTISRILELFPADARKAISQSLAYNLKAVVCQKLLPCVKTGISRVPAVEVLRVTPMVRELLEAERFPEIGDVIRSSEGDAMCSFTTSLHDLIESDMIDPNVAYAAAPNVEELKMRMKGIRQSQSGLIGRR